MFVVSLAYFAYAYFVRMGRPVETAWLPPVAAVTTNGLLFTVFAVHHSVLARSGAKRWLGTHVDPRLERTLYVWVASVLFAAVCWAWVDIPGVVYARAGPAAGVHWAAVAAGAWLTLHAARSIEPLELAGIRQAAGNLTPASFKVQGPYRLVRHPIYLGWILLVFGVPVMTSTRLAFAVISSAYLVVAIPFEERSLVETFGDDYRRYQHDVRWRLLPGVW
jgi:protein-S-isoprenylcysteine O-methyltransferase Ste14